MAGNAALARNAVVVTSDPAVFAATLAPFANRVAILDNAAETLRFVAEHQPALVVADLLPLRDGVSGQRLLRSLVTGVPSDPRVYLMAERWAPVQQQWTIKLGAAGTLPRDPGKIVSFLMGTGAGHSKQTQLTIQRVDENFLRHAGPIGNTQLSRLKAGLTADELADVPSYVEQLSLLLHDPRQRATFLRQSQGIPGAESTNAQSTVGDPWMHQVNNLFIRYAGALAARLAIKHALGKVEVNGSFSRAAYVNALASQLLDPGRATSFVNALRDVALTDT